MEYTLLPGHEAIRAGFVRRFVLPYGAYCHANAEQLSRLPMRYRRGFTQRYYASLPLSDRLIPEFSVLSFAEALAQLRSMEAPVRFMTNAPGGIMREHCILGTRRSYAAEADPKVLADTLEREWFTEYVLAEQGMYLADRILPSEVYVFDPGLTQCLIFTHETDETERPETRVCLCFADKEP